MSDIPNSALGFVLQNLKEFVQDNAELLGGVKDEAEELCRSLDTLKAFIKVSTERPDGRYYEIAENLANEIRVVVYRAEDAIEKYIHCALVNKKSAINRLFPYITELKNVAREIKKVNKAVKDIYQNQVQLELQIEALDINTVERNNQILVIDEEDDVVGFEVATKVVIELLTGEDQSQDLEVISITGMFGVGKTTLAKKVFNHPIIEFKFYTKAFVNLSQEYDRKEVFLKIFRAFVQQVPEEMNEMPDEDLAEELKKQLMGRKYLIVLDDVWNTRAWDDLKIAFPHNKKRSRVLITSRHRHVATHANKKIDPYELGVLNGEESKELFRRKAFGKNPCPRELEEYEVRILSKCAGLPLAIVVVAGILVNKSGDQIDRWSRVAEDVNTYYENIAQIDNVINLSYNHMPSCLKPCFLYLGVFREDFDIPVWKLIRLWIAEGFIQRNGNVSLEDIAGGYVEELADRNLVMVGQRRSTGQIKTFRIHDTLRDFCKKKAKKENLFHEIKRSDDISALCANSSLNTFRRLCVNAVVLDYIEKKPAAAEYVRSFLSFSKEETILPKENASYIPKASKLLRVLDSSSIIFPHFPKDLLNLVLLKYMAISGKISALPEKMSNLMNLETLIVETSSGPLEIKVDIWKLTKLRHLQTNVSTLLQNPREESSVNANLQTLSTISPESCSMEMFRRAPKLKKLGIRGKLGNISESVGQSSLFPFLVRLEDLENLKLLNDDGNVRLYSLPQENNFPGKLRKLTLMKTLLDWRYVSTLGKLEKLEVLKLKDNAFRGDLWETQDGGFRCLKVLHIGSTNLARWKAGASHFPKLRSLFLRHCTALEAVPFALGDISTLQEIDLYCTNTNVAASARKIQLMKLSVQAQDKKKKGVAFKFSVYPPDPIAASPVSQSCVGLPFSFSYFFLVFILVLTICISIIFTRL